MQMRVLGTWGSNILARVEPHYARAERLYDAAALALQDERHIRQDFAAG
jgi:hypothetical protein